MDEVWSSIHSAQAGGGAVSNALPSNYDLLPLGTLLESMGVMSMEGLGFPLSSYSSFLPHMEAGSLAPPYHMPILTLPELQVCGLSVY